MAFNPKVSIVIPVYNGSNYLSEAIDSALAQTYGNVEVIVINDGSNDGGKTEAIAKAYGDKIRYLHKENGGVSTALNLGIRAMSGEYFSWLSHDDIYYPNKIESQVNFLSKLNKRDVILYGSWEFIDHNSISTGFRMVTRRKPVKSIYAVMDCLINGSTLLIPKKCFDEAGLFDESLAAAQEYDLCFRFARRYEFVYTPEILLKYRVHPQQDTVRRNDILLKEEIVLHSGFGMALTDDEIANLEKSSALFFIKRAVFFVKRTIDYGDAYSEAEDYSYKLFKENLFKRDNVLYIPECIFLFLKYAAMKYALTKRVRGIIRNRPYILDAYRLICRK